MLNIENATIASSLMTNSSLLIAAIDRPAPAERIAVLDAREEPGSDSRIDCALFLGSSVGTGTFEADLVDVRELGIAGRICVLGSTGRRRAAPMSCQRLQTNGV